MLISNRALQLFLVFLVTLVLFSLQQTVLFMVAVFFLLVVNINRFINFQLSRIYILWALFLTMLIMPSFFDVAHGFSSLFYFYGTIVCLLSAKFTAERYSLHDIYAAVRLLFICFTLFLCFFLHKYWGLKEPFGQIIDGSSTNGLPSYFILVQVLLSSVSYLLFGRVNLLFAAITFGVAFFGNGRGSLVVAIAIIAFSVFVNIFLRANSRGSFRRFWAVVFSLTLAITVSLVFSYFWTDLVTLTKLSVGLADANRIEIISQYLGNLDGLGVIFGGSYSGTVIATEYQGNPHISLIRAHYLFGLVPTLVYMLSPALIIFLVKDKKAKFVLFGYLGLVWLRVLSEPILFPTVMDYFYFLIFFIGRRYAGESYKYSS